ncbi:MAG: cell division protein FtsQ [Candidatus Atribacteria bacterium]|jgi:cell division protein FtsQ|nr:cell division protein FtsQ [Candidatus Atribacteria bacterium]
MFFRSAVFRVKHLEIIGVENPATIIDALDMPSGINIFRVKGWEIQRKLELLPMVKEARVEKVLPDTLKIIVQLREPFALVVVGNQSFCVDEQGQEIPCSEGEQSLKPLVRLPRLEDILLQESLALVRVWREKFQSPLAEVEAINEKLFILKLQNGIFIKCESASNLEQKALVLEAVLKDAVIQAIQVGGFDIRTGEEIFVIPSGGEK